MKFNWKSYYQGVSVQPISPKDKKRAKAMERVVNFMIIKQREAQDCLYHKMGYSLFEDAYRLYRRGKNRCVRCGVRL